MSGKSTTRDTHAGMPDAILEHLAEGVSLIDADLNIVAFNRRFLELLDFPAERFRPGMPLEDFFRFNAERGEYGPGDVEAQVKERIDLARRFEPHEFERTRPDGTVLEIRGRPLSHGGFVTVYSDITARKRSEVEEKTRERQLLAQTIEHMAEGFALFDSGERLIVCNSRYRAMFPKIAEHLRPGISFAELVKLVEERGQIVEIGGREYDSFADERLAAWRRGETFDYLTSEGRWIEVRDNVTADGQRICLRLDVTDRKHAEAALLASGERYRALITSALDAVVTINEEGRLTHWNPQAEKIFGWSSSEAVGRLLHETLIPERFRKAHLEGMERFRSTGKSSISNRRLELSALHRSGHEFPVELTVIPLRRGKELAFSAFIRDITERVRVREALNASEARFRDFAETASDWLWEMDENLRFTWHSDRFERVTGINPASLHGKRREESDIEGVNAEMLAKHVEDLEARRSFRDFVFARRRPDGSLMWRAINGKPIFDNEDKFKGYRGTGGDITAIKETEAALRESEARFREFANIASDWRWEMDEQLRFTFISRRFEDLTGILTKLMIGKTRELSGVEGVDEQAIARHVADMEARRPFRDFVFARRRPDGKLIWVSVSGDPRFDDGVNFLGYRGIGRDITERVEAKAEIESLARFHSENPNPVLRITRDGVIHAANAASTALLQIWGSKAGHQVSQDLKTRVEEILASDSVRQLEVRGKARTFRLNLVPVAEAGYVNVYGEDVTDQKKTEQRLMQMQKMEAIGQITGGVAHDFNNRLTVILGSLELLEERLGENDAALRLVRGAHRAAEGGAQLTRRLLTFSRRQMLEPEVVNVNTLLHNLEEILRHTLGEPIDVQLKLAADPWPVHVDTGQFDDAILNLAVNARDAMPGGGRLTVETANVDLSDENLLRHEYMAPGEYVLIALTDTGSGIPKDIQERIFEPFFSTKEKGKGTGLGLAMVYGFAKQSKGYVNVYSEAELGTCVKLFLPRHWLAAKDERKVRRKPAEAEMDRVATVLVVEDDPGVREVAVTLIKDFGYRVLEAEDGAQALELVARDAQFDILFTDMVMPGNLTGMELAEQILRQRPAVKVIYTSGYTEKGPFDRRDRADMIHWIAKPYTRSTLAKKLREALGG